MKKVLFFLFFFPFWLYAQDDAKYLEGAVPVIDGKVVFQKEVTVPNLTSEQIFQRIQSWMKERFSREGCHLVYQNAERGQLAAIGEEYIEFSRTTLALDRAHIRYQMTVRINDHTCLAQLQNISYTYSVVYQREPEKYEAETWITDKYALHKGKLNRISGKFRRKTIDFAEDLFTGLDQALGMNTPQTAQPQQVPPETAIATPAPAPREGYQASTPDKLPEIIKSMLPESLCSLETTKGKVSVTWRGMGKLFGKDIASIAIAENSLADLSLKDGNTYLISFSRTDGEANDWMLIECRKSGETVEEDKVIITGEILGIWMK